MSEKEEKCHIDTKDDKQEEIVLKEPIIKPDYNDDEEDREKKRKLTERIEERGFSGIFFKSMDRRNKISDMTDRLKSHIWREDPFRKMGKLSFN